MRERLITKLQGSLGWVRRTGRLLGGVFRQRVSMIRLTGCGGTLLILLSLGMVLWLLTHDVADILVSGGDPEAITGWAELVGLHVLALLVVALIFELGPALARRIKKIGPVELFAEEVRDILPEVRKILDRAPSSRHGRGRLVVTREALKLDRQARYFTEKANALVYYIEYSELRGSRIVREQDVLRLLSQMAGVALDQHHWARALDRLELVDDLSKGRYEPQETQKRRALAAMKLAETLTRDPEDEAERQALLRQARRAARKAVKLDPGDWQSYYLLGTVNFQLGHLGGARDQLRKAARLNPKHAPTKYNLACTYVALGEEQKALRWLKRLKREDDDLEAPLEFADRDPDLGPLRQDPVTRDRLQRILGIRTRWLKKRPYPWLEEPPSGRSLR